MIDKISTAKIFAVLIFTVLILSYFVTTLSVLLHEE